MNTIHYFQTHFEGIKDSRFDSLQGAMAYAETLDAPTGFIVYVPQAGGDGYIIVKYTEGDIEDAQP